jgi:hypothetical protein
MWNWNVLTAAGDTIRVEGADAYQPDGPLTTFFCAGSNRTTIDSWSVRIASYRTAAIVALERRGLTPTPAPLSDHAKVEVEVLSRDPRPLVAV